MTAEVIDARLTDMIRVMAGSRGSLQSAGTAVAGVNYMSARAEEGRRLTAEHLAEARVLLRQAIATLVAVHANLHRAEQNLAEVGK